MENEEEMVAACRAAEGAVQRRILAGGRDWGGRGRDGRLESASADVGVNMNGSCGCGMKRRRMQRRIHAGGGSLYETASVSYCR